MDYSFWNKLPKPFFALAPMADVTDAAFRRIIAKYSRHGETGGGPDVFWTEFVSADGLCSAGREVLRRDLEFTTDQHPIVAQLFTSNPDTMREAVKLVKELGFDGVDINMGCPDRSIEKQGAGAAMIKNPERARAVIRAAKEAAGDMPVSVKTRLGYNKNEFETWIPEILKEDIAALTIHGRTRKDLSLVPARWDDIARVASIVRGHSPNTLVIGNGDAKDLVDAQEKIAQSGVDGVMLGRAIFGNPWLFDSAHPKITVAEKLRVALEHTKLFMELLGDIKSFAIMKKHYKAYVNGFPGAKELRVQMMESHSVEEIESHVKTFLDLASDEIKNQVVE